VDKSEKKLRYALAREISHYFVFHLREELKKPPAVSDYITMEGVPFSKLTNQMIHKLESEFPGIGTTKPLFNFFKEWWGLMQSTGLIANSHSYEESTFKIQNQIIFFKILDIKKKENRIREKFYSKMSETVEELRSKGRYISYELQMTGEFSFFYFFEIILRRARLPYHPGKQILFEQTFFLQRIAYKIMDQELKKSLNQSKTILRAILPEKIADELEQEEKVRPRSIARVAVMFCDLVGFTQLSETLSPEDLLVELDDCFSHFDSIARLEGVEKIKTIGDSYMAVSGLEGNTPNPAVNCILTALRFQEFLRKYEKSKLRKGIPSWKVRIGIHLGPVVAGVLGQTRFNYDIWGDTVNTAQRMEAYGEASMVNVSRAVLEASKDFFDFETRKPVQVKGKGEMEMFFVKGILPELSLMHKGRTPNKKFREILGF
jgi:class 3 adenylate cyclase